MLTIRIDSVKVNKKIEIDGGDFNFGLLEREVYELGLSIARRVMEGVMGHMDKRIRKSRPRKVFENCGKREK